MSSSNDGPIAIGFPRSPNSPADDAKSNRTRSRREALIVVAVLFLIFGVFLPQFIDYGQVIESMLALTWAQILVLFALGGLKTFFDAGVYNTLIPGLSWWSGWKAWAASNSVAFIAPPGADLAIRFGMYRTAGITGEAAGASLILSWFFATGYKLIVPIVALTWVLIEESSEDTVLITVAVIGIAALVGGVGLISLVLYRDHIARRVGETTQRWYNGLVGGKWKFPEAVDLGTKTVDFRLQILATLRARWIPATLMTIAAQAVFFAMLVLSLRFVGVTAENAPGDIVFDAYAIGLLLSMIPIFPGGIGVVEMAYVAVIVGNAQDAELANAVAAGAFVHRIFSWLIPILIGLIPLAAWRREMVKGRDPLSSHTDLDREIPADPST
jgi:putative heme transporter